MKKEYMVNISFDGMRIDAKAGVRAIETLIRNEKADVVAKNVDYENWVDFSFTLKREFGEINAIVNRLFDSLKTTELKISCEVSDYVSKLILRESDLGGKSSFDKEISDLEVKTGLKIKSVESVPFKDEVSLVALTFEDLKSRDAFKTQVQELLSTKGVESPWVEIEWVSTPVIKRDGSEEKKKTLSV